MLGPIVQQMAPLAERLDVAVPPPAMRGVVVEMRRRQHHLGRPARLLLGRGRTGDLAAAAITPGLPPSSHQRPSPRWRTTWPCGRPQASQQPLARTNRTQWLICGQSIG